MITSHDQGAGVDQEAARNFLAALWPEDIPEGLHLLIWTKGQQGVKRSAWFAGIAPAVAYLQGQAGADSYLGCGLSPQDFGPAKRCPADQIAAIPGLWADLDIADPAHQKDNLPPSLKDAQGLLDAVPGFPPSLVVHSGHGIHAWWLFKEPWIFDKLQERQDAAALCRRLQQALKDRAREKGWDVDSTADLSRVLRIPGTWNHKSNPPVPVAIHPERAEARYNPDDFDDCLPPDPGPARQASPEATRSIGMGLVLDPLANPPEGKFEALRANEPRFMATWNHQRPDLQDQSLSSFDLALASFAALSDWTDQEIADLLIAHRRRYGSDKDKDKSLRSDYMAKTISRARSVKVLGTEAQAILDLARETKDAVIIMEAAPRLAKLPHKEWAIVRGSLNQILPSLNLKELNRAVDESQRQQRQTETGRHQVIINHRQLRDVVEETIKGMQVQNEPPCIFVHAGSLTRFRIDEKGRPLAETLTDNSLRVTMTNAVDFYRESKAGLMDDTPSPELVKSVLALGSWPFPSLEGIIEIPTLREDGTILDQQGYDQGTGLYYHPAPGLIVPLIPEQPTQKQARDMAGFILNEVLVDFPFENQASRANMLGCLITPIIRQALVNDLPPLALIDAPQAGTGKSLLSEVVALVATGRAAAMLGAPGRSNDDEWRKAITSILLDGTTVICWDNLESALDSPSLARALTARTWSDRPLGVSKKIEVPNRATWIANGNNVSLGGDLPRRCYLIRLDAKMARPWKRDGFKHANLAGWVQSQRGQIIAALLTMARAWFVSGEPAAKGTPTVGGFQRWCDMTGGILHYAGVTGFLDNLQAMYQREDIEGEQWERFLCVLFGQLQEGRQTPDVAWTAAEAMKYRKDMPDALSGALAEAPPGTTSHKLGMAFRSRRGSRFGDSGAHVEEGPRDKARNSKTWLVMVDQPEKLTQPHMPTVGGEPFGGGVAEASLPGMH